MLEFKFLVPIQKLCQDNGNIKLGPAKAYSLETSFGSVVIYWKELQKILELESLINPNHTKTGMVRLAILIILLKK